MAIDDLLDEHEQSERVLDWLRRNGAGLIGGVVVGLGLIGGWQWWQKQLDAQQLRSSDQYHAVVKQLEAKDIKQAKRLSGELEGSAYAPLAALDIAKQQVDAGKRDDAIATLRGVATSDAGLQQIARQRLARLLLDAGKGQEALTTLGAADDAASLEARGDAQLALGHRDEARKAYHQALSKLDVAAPQRRLLEFKLADIGGTPARPETRP